MQRVGNSNAISCSRLFHLRTTYSRHSSFCDHCRIAQGVAICIAVRVVATHIAHHLLSPRGKHHFPLVKLLLICHSSFLFSILGSYFIPWSAVFLPPLLSRLLHLLSVRSADTLDVGQGLCVMALGHRRNVALSRAASCSPGRRASKTNTGYPPRRRTHAVRLPTAILESAISFASAPQ